MENNLKTPKKKISFFEQLLDVIVRFIFIVLLILFFFAVCLQMEEKQYDGVLIFGLIFLFVLGLFYLWIIIQRKKQKKLFDKNIIDESNADNVKDHSKLICPKCNTENNTTDSVCTNCHYAFTKEGKIKEGKKSKLRSTIGEFIRIYWNRNKYVKNFIDKTTDNFTEKQLGEDLTKIIKSNAFKASIICGFSAIIPLIGENIIAPFFGILFTWLTYLTVNKKVGIPLSGNFIKTVVAGVSTNIVISIIFYYVVIHILTLVMMVFFEIIPPFAIVVYIVNKLMTFALIYVIIIASAIIYMKIFVNFFADKEDKNNNQNNDTNKIYKENIMEIESPKISKQQTTNEKVEDLKEEIEKLREELSRERNKK